eukprot:1188637-Prorocentrum_minimum.AAC.3
MPCGPQGVVVPLVHHAIGDGTTLVAVMFSLMDNTDGGVRPPTRRPRRESLLIPPTTGYPVHLRAPMLVLDMVHVAWVCVFGCIEAVRR